MLRRRSLDALKAGFDFEILRIRKRVGLAFVSHVAAELQTGRFWRRREATGNGPSRPFIGFNGKCGLHRRKPTGSVEIREPHNIP